MKLREKKFSTTAEKKQYSMKVKRATRQTVCFNECPTTKTQKTTNLLVYLYIYIYLLHGLNTRYVIHWNSEESKVWGKSRVTRRRFLFET